MSRREGDIFIVASESLQQCDGCGKIDKLRPYGPGGTKIYFDRGTKNPEETMRRFDETTKGVTKVFIGDPGGGND